MTDTILAHHVDYKIFLRGREQRARVLERGFRSRLAEAMGVQSAFVTQVLNGDANLSLEQGLRGARHLGLDELDQEYFLGLISLARAGTPELRRLLQKRLAALRAELLNLKRVVSEAGALNEERRAIYYGHWSYAAIHILVTIPGYRDPAAIGPALGLTEDEVRSGLRFLVEAGLVVSKAGRLKPGATELHLERGSRWLRQHHAHWRLKAVDHFGRHPADGIHYTAISSLSEDDERELKARLVALIKDYTEIVRDSAEERLCAFALDFYRLV